MNLIHIKSMIRNIGWILSLCLLLPVAGIGQRLSYESVFEITLSDGINIILYKGVDNQNYYYLPPAQSIRLGQKADGTPEFLFMKYTTEQRVDQGGAQGAILHFLVEWGLTPGQFTELQNKLKERTSNLGKLAGPVDLQATQGESFRIVSAILQEKTLTTSYITSGMAPPIPGGKAAVAARLDKNGAQLLDATFQKAKSITDLSLVLDYEYTVLVKAAKGKLTYNLDISHTQGDGIAYDLMKKELDNEPQKFQAALNYYNASKQQIKDECGVAEGFGNVILGMKAIDVAIGNTSASGSGGVYEYGISEGMMRKIYDHFVSEERIKLEWEENIPDERLNVIREAFFDFFLNAFAEPDFPELGSIAQLQDATGVGGKEITEAEGAYSFKSCTQMEAKRSISKTVILDNILLPVKRRYQMVSNLASTYNQVKDNKKCVVSVNLNDPFFQHRDINFIVDLEALEIFDKEVNYATVNVMKKRSSGNDFNDALTISKEYIAKNGKLATITYARGEDKNTDKYKYKVQWSLKGGNIYPEEPEWIEGDWQGVTLAVPIKPRKLEFEADIDKLKEMGITRATLQVRYQKFGKEMETNIPISVVKKEPLVSQTIFTDRDQAGYAYRMIFNHQTEGKLALPWEAKINDDYVYATIPDELMDKDSEIFKKAVEAAKTIFNPAEDGTVSKQAQILDKITDMLGVILNINQN